MDEFLNKMKNEILKKDKFLEEIIKKAFAGMPRATPPSPKGMGSTGEMGKKQIGDTVKRGKKEFRIVEIDPTKKGWARFTKLEAIEGPKEEAISTKGKKELPSKEGKKLTPEEKKGFKDTIEKLKEKVSGKIQEKLGKKPVEPEAKPPAEERLTQALATPKGEAESQAAYNLRLWAAGTNFISEFAKKLDAIPTSGPAAEVKKQEINNMIQNVYTQLNQKTLSLKQQAARGTSYEGAKSTLKGMDNKIISGQRLTREEGLQYDKLQRQINKEDERTNAVLALQNEKSIHAARAEKQAETSEKLSRGEKLYGQFGTYKAQPLKVTPKEKMEDTQTFLNIRYEGIPLQKVKTNNKNVINSFTKLNNIRGIVGSGVKVNSIKGEIRFPFDPTKIKALEKSLKLSYGKDAAKYFTMDRGTPGGETKINVKKVAGIDWEIKPLPAKNLGESINGLQEGYSSEAKSGKRIEYKFEFTSNQYMSNSPADPGGQNFVIFQGDQRAGKGATFGTMMNQAMGSANKDIVQFYNFDPTGAFWNGMKTTDPNVVKNLEKKGLLGHNGVAAESLKGMDAKTQAKAVGDYVNQFVDKYNEEYIKRDALMGAKQADHIGKIQDQQIPQAVFNFDEIQQFENMILNNPEIEDGDRKAMLQKMAGVLSTQKTNGKKRGMTVNIGVQQGFHSDELKRVTKSPNNTLVSLDGNAEISSFGRVRGFQNAINTASIGSAVTLTTGKPDQLPTTHSPIIPGVGTAKQLAER